MQTQNPKTAKKRVYSSKINIARPKELIHKVVQVVKTGGEHNIFDFPLHTLDF